MGRARGRPGDLLWSGTAYQEFTYSGKSGYVGGLTELSRKTSQPGHDRKNAARNERATTTLGGGAEGPSSRLLVDPHVVGSLLGSHSAEQARIAKSNELGRAGEAGLAG